MKKTGFPAYLPALPHDRCTGISGYSAKTMFRHEKRLYKNMRRHQPYLAMLITMEKYSGSHFVTDNAVPPMQSESRVPPKSIRFPGDQTEKQPYTVFRYRYPVRRCNPDSSEITRVRILLSFSPEKTAEQGGAEARNPGQ